ncbi:hypothetical protein, partial [Salmonella enterica]
EAWLQEHETFRGTYEYKAETD